MVSEKAFEAKYEEALSRKEQAGERAADALQQIMHYQQGGKDGEEGKNGFDILAQMYDDVETLTQAAIDHSKKTVVQKLSNYISGAKEYQTALIAVLEQRGDEVLRKTVDGGDMTMAHAMFNPLSEQLHTIKHLPKDIQKEARHTSPTMGYMNEQLDRDVERFASRNGLSEVFERLKQQTDLSPAKSRYGHRGKELVTYELDDYVYNHSVSGQLKKALGEYIHMDHLTRNDGVLLREDMVRKAEARAEQAKSEITGERGYTRPDLNYIKTPQREARKLGQEDHEVSFEKRMREKEFVPAKRKGNVEGNIPEASEIYAAFGIEDKAPENIEYLSSKDLMKKALNGLRKDAVDGAKKAAENAKSATQNAGENLKKAGQNLQKGSEKTGSFLQRLFSKRGDSAQEHER